LKKPVFTGSCTALVTPMRNGNIDYRRLADYLEFQSKNGTSALVLCGTTGESSTLSDKEQEDILEYCIRNNAGRMKILAGVGGNCTSTCLKKAVVASKLGVDGLLMSTPYYNKTSQQGVIYHFLTVADTVDLPLVLYNIPQRTGMGIFGETYETLSKHPNINGVKEASGDLSLVSEIRYRCGNELTVWSGNDDNTLAFMSMGAKGVISVASNVFPAAIAKLCQTCLNGDYVAAEKINRKLYPIFKALFIDVNPMPVKFAMEYLGMEAGVARLPLTELSADHKNAVIQALRSVDRIF